MGREIDAERYGPRDAGPTRGDERHDAAVSVATLLAFINSERSEWMGLDDCVAGIRGFLAGIRASR